MCRLSAFFGAPICAADLVTRPSRSIITQSFDARERMAGDAATPAYLNGDGFGLGWYSPHPHDVTPCVYRHARPAWNDPNLGSIAEKVYTPVLFAHVRAASPGLDVSESTCHPFRYGRYLWMHNGGLGDFASLRRHILPTLSEPAFDFAVTHGSSDTALCFAIFLNHIRDEMAPTTPEHLRDCLQKTIITIERALNRVNATETSLLNFVVSDGDSLVASRYVVSLTNPHAGAASLYYASGNSYQSDGSAPGNYAMLHTDRRPSLAIISSEPLTEKRADWVAVPTNYTIVITKSMHILLSPINENPKASISRILANLAVTRSPNANSMPFLPKLVNGVTPLHNDSFSEGTKTIGIATNAPLSSSVRRQIQRHPHAQSPSSAHLTVASTVRATITIPNRTVLCCAVMHSLLFSGTDDGTIHVWDMEDNVQSDTLESGHSAVLALLADTESGLLISATSASTVTIFKSVGNKRFERTFLVCCQGNGDVLSLAKVNERIFAGFSDANIRCVVKDVFAVEPSRTASTNKECLDALHCGGPNAKLMDCGYAFSQTREAVTHNGFVFAAVSCLQNRFLCTGCGDGILRVWNAESEECIQTREDHAGAILTLAAYEVSQGTMLFSGSRDCSVKVWVWDGESGFICKRTLRKHKDDVIFLTVCGDKLVSGSADGVVCVWCVETLALLCQYKDSSLKAGATSPQYGLLFTASDEGAIQVRDVISAELSQSDAKHHNANGAVENGIPDARMQVPEMEGLSQTKHQWSTRKTESMQAPSGNTTLSNEPRSCSRIASSGTSVNAVVSELDDDSDDVDTLVPGVTNELILAPPMSPVTGASTGLKKRLSNLLDEAGTSSSGISFATDELLDEISGTAGSRGNENGVSEQALERRLMQDVLSRFVSFATVSGVEEYRESCWQGCRYLGSFLEGLGASVKFVSTNVIDNPRRSSEQILRHISTRDAKSLASSSSNPVVLARFASANPSAKTIVFYGHYDVMPVDAAQWKTDPWSLTAVDGYLYGRGSTDNKGPIMAMIFAIKKLLEESRDGLGINIVLVFQGEGEVANAGFKDCIRSHLHWFEGASLILTSNSSWLGEEKPCITYGFRGVIELLVSVTGGTRNLHSGVDGGATFEPMNDLITILGTMVDASGVVCIPGFYDDVQQLTQADRKLLERVDFTVDEYLAGTGVKRVTAQNAADLLEARWRTPSVSITSIDSSNSSGFYSVIPRQASAKISVRFVRDQDPEKLEKALAAHLEFELRKRRSPNQLKVDCVNRGDWWLGDPCCEHFQIAASAVRSVWGVEPEYVCEGGSMPLFSFLAKTLEAPLVQVPLGQSSGMAHLPNERIRTKNFFRGKEVIQKIIQDFAKFRETETPA